MTGRVKGVLPSKLPCSEQYSSSLVYVSRDGWNTNTPELKQSGHPGSGAADSSSLSNSSSIFESTWEWPTSAKKNVCCYNNIQAKVSPSCLHPWRHIWSNVWESSSGVWWRWPPGQAASSWPDAPCRRCPARPPLWPRQRCSSAQTWRVTRL